MMNDPNLTEKILNSKVVEKAYDDGLSTPVKETSKIITYLIKTVQLICLPLQLTAAYQERLEKRLKNTIEKVSEENRVIPPDSISVPVINYLSYVEDGNLLVELYQNLLARAMDRTRNSEAHPGFIVTINQLSPDEALLLYELKFKSLSFTRIWDFDRRKNKFFNMRMLENEFPINKLLFSKNFNMYIGHLEKLDLICVFDKKSLPIKDKNTNIQIGSQETYTMGCTQFGKLFVQACLPDNK